MKELTEKQRETIAELVDMEGFDYGMENYLDDVKNKRFQELRAAYLEAKKNLADFCGLDV